jgi:hypothetical protein
MANFAISAEMYQLFGNCFLEQFQNMGIIFLSYDSASSLKLNECTGFLRV